MLHLKHRNIFPLEAPHIMLAYLEEFNNVSVILRLVLSVIMGAVIGMERPFRRHDAGLRTFALVALGYCLATVVYFLMFLLYG